MLRIEAARVPYLLSQGHYSDCYGDPRPVGLAFWIDPKELGGHFHQNRSQKYRSKWNGFLGFLFGTYSHFPPFVGETRCWSLVPAPAGCSVDRAEFLCNQSQGSILIQLTPQQARQAGPHTLGTTWTPSEKIKATGTIQRSRENCVEGGKGGDQEGLWPQTVQKIRIDPSWATWEAWIRWREGPERPFWRGCMVSGLTKWGSARLSHSDPISVPIKLCICYAQQLRRFPTHLELQQTCETWSWTLLTGLTWLPES